MQRREFLTRAAYLTSAASATLAAPGALAGTLAGPAKASTRRTLNSTQRALLPPLAELIIPRTETPGAVEAGVPAFMHAALQRWYTDAEFTVFAEGFAWLERAAQERHGHAFVRCDTAQQTALLSETEVQARDWHRAHPEEISSDSLIGKTPINEHTPFFTRLKELVTVGYFTSELAAQTAMMYLPIPMRYTGEASLADSGGKQFVW